LLFVLLMSMFSEVASGRPGDKTPMREADGHRWEEEAVTNADPPSAVERWMGEIDPSQLGFPFELDRSQYSK
jgi:hypothetical protein